MSSPSPPATALDRARRGAIGHARANAVAYLALFVAVGGTSYAAATLPSRSVGTRQIKPSAVTSAKVRDGSLLARDFRRGAFPSGAAGARGPAGAAGAKGADGAPGADGATGPRGPSAGYSTGSSGFSPAGAAVSSSIPLPAGKYLVSGRVMATTTDPTSHNPACTLASYPAGLNDTTYIAVPASGPIAGASLLGTVDLPSGGTVGIVCPNTAGVSFGRMQVQALQVQTLG